MGPRAADGLVLQRLRGQGPPSHRAAVCRQRLGLWRLGRREDRLHGAVPRGHRPGCKHRRRHHPHSPRQVPRHEAARVEQEQRRPQGRGQRHRPVLSAFALPSRRRRRREAPLQRLPAEPVRVAGWLCPDHRDGPGQRRPRVQHRLGRPRLQDGPAAPVSRLHRGTCARSMGPDPPVGHGRVADVLLVRHGLRQDEQSA